MGRRVSPSSGVDTMERDPASWKSRMWGENMNQAPVRLIESTPPDLASMRGASVLIRCRG